MLLTVVLLGLHCPEATCFDCAGDEVVAQQMTTMPHSAALVPVSFVTVPTPTRESMSGVSAGSAVPVDLSALCSRLLI